MSQLESLKNSNTVARIHITRLRQNFDDKTIHNSYKETIKEVKEYIKLEKKRLEIITPQDEEKFQSLLDPSSIWKRVSSKLQSQKKDDKKQKVTKKEEEELRKYTDSVKKVYNLDQEFLKYFNEYSFYNEFVGQCLFYISLCTLVKNRTDIKLGNAISLMQHFFLIQDSGTGKDRAFDYVIDVLEEVNNFYQYKHNAPEKLVNIYQASGTETVESYVDSLQMTTQGKVKNPENPVIIPGILSENDLIVLRECSFLLKGKEQDDKQSKREVFLQAIEGRPIVKRLKSWDGLKTETYCRACVIGATRPFENMKEHIVNTGLQQRAINYMRKVGKEERDKMIDAVIDHSFLTNEEYTYVRRGLKDVAKELYAFYEFFQKTNFIFDQRDKMRELKRKVMKEFSHTIEEEFKMDMHKELMRTFQGRLTSIIDVITILNCGIRRDNKVSSVDIERAIDFVRTSFNSLKTWVEDSINISQQEERKMEKWEKMAKKAFKKSKILKKSDFIGILQSNVGVSQGTAYKIYKTFLDNIYTEKNKVLTLKNDASI